MSTTSNHNQNPVSQPPCQGDTNQLQEQSQQKQPITTNLASDDYDNGSSNSYHGPIRKMVSLQIRTNVTRRTTTATTMAVDCPPTPGTPEHMTIPSLGLNSSSWNVHFFCIIQIDCTNHSLGGGENIHSSANAARNKLWRSFHVRATKHKTRGEKDYIVNECSFLHSQNTKNHKKTEINSNHTGIVLRYCTNAKLLSLITKVVHLLKR